MTSPFSSKSFSSSSAAEDATASEAPLSADARRALLERILKCLRLADSTNDVEALHAFRTARRLMASALIDWSDVLSVRNAAATEPQPRTPPGAQEERARPPGSRSRSGASTRSWGQDFDDANGAGDDVGAQADFEACDDDLDDDGASGRAGAQALDVNWSAIVLRHPLAARITDERWVEAHLLDAGPDTPGDGPRLWQGLKDLLETLYHQSSGPKPARQRLRKLLKGAKRDGFLSERELRGLCHLCQKAAAGSGA